MVAGANSCNGYGRPFIEDVSLSFIEAKDVIGDPASNEERVKRNKYKK